MEIIHNDPWVHKGFTVPGITPGARKNIHEKKPVKYSRSSCYFSQRDSQIAVTTKKERKVQAPKEYKNKVSFKKKNAVGDN